MTRRTRYFLFGSITVLLVGLCTGLVAYYTGLPMGAFSRTGEPAELDRFESLRVEQASLLAGLADGGWERVGVHGEHGRITVQQLAAHTAGEDADHFAQIARMIPA